MSWRPAHAVGTAPNPNMNGLAGAASASSGDGGLWGRSAITAFDIVTVRLVSVSVSGVAEKDAKPAALPELGDKTVHLTVVRASWNAELVDRLAEGVRHAVADMGAHLGDTHHVPGCYELPLGCRKLAHAWHQSTANSPDAQHLSALVALGVVIRGETSHYELVAEAAATGVLRTQLDYGMSIGFGVLAVENRDQALERSQHDSQNNAGYDAAVAAVTMALFG